MSVYNGSLFLKEQIDSIVNQSCQDWKLIIRDDGSKDDSVAIINDYVVKYPNKIFILKDCYGNLGATKSFEQLLNISDADYIMFSDQDDVWKRNKIEVSVLEIKKMEELFPNKPCLVSTDAVCIDENGRILCDSFFKSQKFFNDVEGDAEKMFALNIVQGSTALFNKIVKKYVFPFPANHFHDKWIAVITAYYGHYKYIHKQTLLYRQHLNNVVGANSINFVYFVKRLRKQMTLLYDMYKVLPFKMSLLKVLGYKAYYTLKRL